MAYENVDKSPRKPVSHQARALFRKNLSLKARQPCSICCHFVFPILLICVVGGIGLLIDTLIGSLEGTKVEPTPHVLNAPFGYCYEWFLYADPSKGDSPGTLTANGTGSGMLEKINQTDCTSFAQTSSFVPFFNLENSETAIDDFLYDVQAKLRNIPLDELTEADREELPDAAVIFNSLSYNNLSIDYTLQIPNPQASSQYFYLQSFLRINKLNGDYTGSVINLLDSALLSYMSDSKYYLNTTTQAFPYFMNVDQIKNTVTNMMGMIIYPFALSLLLPSFIHAIVLEKQERLRELMKMMGMKMSLYWLLTFCFDMFLYLVVAVCVLILGAIWSLNLFLQPGVLIFLMFTWGIVQVGLAFLVSTFLSRNRTITTFALYLAVILGVFIGFGLNLNYSGDDYPSYLLLYPPFAFYRGIYLLSEACTDVCMTWSSVTSSSPMATVLTFLWIEALVIYLAAFYLDVVLPQMFGIRKHPLFFIREPYNYFRKSKREYGQPTNFDLSNLGNEDTDVKAERERILSHGGSGNDPIVIKNLSKVYENGKKAVDRLTLAIKENETFGLLGPNGAGKTTTISMLTGLFPPSSGSASICGWDIVNEIDQVHLVIGICPQFDVQWPTLTVEEHLLFYARLKGTDPSKESQDVNEVAQRVGLLQHFKKKSSQLSGGMKRRLSVAMALIGNPSIVFLDEPSSGLDPTSRRNLWEVIDYYKKGRSIILTTHSMEEADTLCTRIGIIAKGRLQCLGSPVHLKNKFGKGYSLYVNFKKR